MLAVDVEGTAVSGLLLGTAEDEEATGKAVEWWPVYWASSSDLRIKEKSIRI